MSVLIFGVLVVGFLALLAAVSPSSRRAQGCLARVPVDDFVVGDLPMVCARTGAPADGLVGVESDESSFQAWWLLLLLLGPLGIVAIAVMWVFGRRPGRVGGSVPMTRAALEDQNRIIGWGNWVAAVPVLAFVTGVAVLAAPSAYVDWLPVRHESFGVVLLVVAMLGGLVALTVSSTLANRRRVSVVLDGTGRWVELRNVHPDFARAADRQVRARHEAGRHRTPR